MFFFNYQNPFHTTYYRFTGSIYTSEERYTTTPSTSDPEQLIMWGVPTEFWTNGNGLSLDVFVAF